MRLKAIVERWARWVAPESGLAPCWRHPSSGCARGRAARPAICFFASRSDSGGFRSLPSSLGARVCRGRDALRGLQSETSPFKYSPGALALVQFLPHDPERAWQLFGGASIALLTGVLLFCVRYPDLRSVGRLVLGLVLAWKGTLETMDYGQLELWLVGLAAAAAATFETAPVFSGLLLGLLPGFKLPWALLFLPFALAARTEHRKRAHRFRRFLSGYLGGWLIWASRCFLR